MRALRAALVAALLLAVAEPAAEAGVARVDQHDAGWIGDLSPGLDSNRLALLRARIAIVQRSQAALRNRQDRLGRSITERGSELLRLTTFEKRAETKLRAAFEQLDHEHKRDERSRMRLTGAIHSLQATPREAAIVRSLDASSKVPLVSARQSVAGLNDHLAAVRQAQKRDHRTLADLTQLHSRSGRLLRELERHERELRLLVTETLRRSHRVADPEQVRLIAHGAAAVMDEDEADATAEPAAWSGQQFGRAFDGEEPFLPVQGRLVDWTQPVVEPPFDRGVLVETEHGSSVFASKTGQIVFAAPFRDLGPILIIAHGNEYHTVLAGFDRLAVSDGESVVVGQTLGMLPVSRQRKPRLYVEIRHRGAPIALLSWLAAREDKVRG